MKKEAPHRWLEEREILHHTVCQHGFDPILQSFVRSFGDRELDSAALMIPMLGFLPFDDPRGAAWKLGDR